MTQDAQLFGHLMAVKKDGTVHYVLVPKSSNTHDRFIVAFRYIYKRAQTSGNELYDNVSAIKPIEVLTVETSKLMLSHVR